MGDMVLLAPEDEDGLGQVLLKRISTAPGETSQTWPLSAAVKRLHPRYEGGVVTVETGDMVAFAVPAVVPQLTDTLIIDGVERAITNLTPIPAAGTTVAWKAWCAA